MPAFAEYTAHPLFDRLEKSLDQVASQLESTGGVQSVSVRRQENGSTVSGERIYDIIAGRASLQLRVSVFPICKNLYEVYADVEGGSTARYTYRMSTGRRDEDSPPTLKQGFTDFLVKEIRSRLASSSAGQAPDGPCSTVPRICLDGEGTITDLSSEARENLGLDPKNAKGRSIFSLVHQKNLRQVMRDLAGMVARGAKRAEWLLRLHTGDERWRWYRVVAQNELRTADRILLRLHPVGSVEASK